MDGILSQDEINALLNGFDLSGDTPPENLADMIPTTSVPEKNDYLSGTSPINGGEELLSDVEKDAIGEVANISMGSSATSLYSLVNRKVDISTPVVSLTTWDNLIQEYEKPCVFIQIKYTKGLDGSNILVLKEQDVKIITSLMMGMDGTATDGPLEELHLSAISEAMNMMMGSSATSLSTMLQTMIDISPPVSSLLDMTELKKGGGEIAPFLTGTFVKVSFRMQIGDLVDSKIMQLYPVEFAKKLVETFINTQLGIAGGNDDGAKSAPTAEPTASYGSPDQGNNAGASMNNMGMNGMNNMGMGGMNDMGMGGMNNMGMGGMNNMGMGGMNNMGMNGMNNMGMNGMNMGMGGMNNMGMGGMNMGMGGMNMGMGGMNMGMNGMNQSMPNYNVQPAQFEPFTPGGMPISGQENISLIMDVPLEVTVELGRTKKSISDILSFAPGTIIDLNRIAGEPIDVLVNGKFVAKGEVVVIEENFGVRVTEIIK